MLSTHSTCLEINLHSVAHTFKVIIDKSSYGAMSTTVNLKAETGKQLSELLLESVTVSCVTKTTFNPVI